MEGLEILIPKFQAHLTVCENVSQHMTELVLKYWQFFSEYCLAKNVNNPKFPHTAYINKVSRPLDFVIQLPHNP